MNPSQDLSSTSQLNFTEVETPEVSESITSPTTADHIPASVTLIPTGLNPVKTLQILRSIGYGLLLLSLIDLLYIIFPPEFTKPIWEYQTIGDLVRLIPVPMIAFMLVFYGESFGRKKIERPVVALLSWSTMVFGVFCLLMIPLTVVNTLRIAQYNNDQINTQVTQQKTQLNNTKNQLDQATPDQIKSLIPIPAEKAGSPANSPTNPGEAKAQVLDNIQKAQKKADEQALDARKNVQQNLIKNSSKIILESLIGGCLFLYTWLVTDWARRRQADVYEGVADGTLMSGRKQKSPKSRRQVQTAAPDHTASSGRKQKSPKSRRFPW
ncbi:MAG: hypothetical protein HC860_00320 [Alkalinema sp. RU_4_3]|nr:hypothetical protein [Alkalinema sp. RU_4_3]